jgi:hypothetical protein
MKPPRAPGAAPRIGGGGTVRVGGGGSSCEFAVVEYTTASSSAKRSDLDTTESFWMCNLVMVI